MTGAIPGAHGHVAHYRVQTAPAVRAALGTALEEPATMSRPAVIHAPIATSAAPSTVIDLPALYRSAIRMPAMIGTLGREILACTIVIGVIGVLNAMLLMRLPKVMSNAVESTIVARVGASVDRALTSARDETIAAVIAALPAPSLRGDGVRTCSCGETISERSRSGLCRRCAQVARLQRPERLERALPSAMLTGDSVEEPALVNRANKALAQARIGQRRQYYTFEFGNANARQPVFIEMFADTFDDPEMRTVTEQAPAEVEEPSIAT